MGRKSPGNRAAQVCTNPVNENKHHRPVAGVELQINFPTGPQGCNFMGPSKIGGAVLYMLFIIFTNKRRLETFGPEQKSWGLGPRAPDNFHPCYRTYLLEGNCNKSDCLRLH